jgi:large subunit ribosomal protein L15
MLAIISRCWSLPMFMRTSKRTLFHLTQSALSNPRETSINEAYEIQRKAGSLNFLNPRFAMTTRPFFPFNARNLRSGHATLATKRKKRKVRGRGHGARGIKKIHQKGDSPNPRTWDGGKNALYKRFPKWPEARKQLADAQNQLEPLNLAKLRYFLEKGRLDVRYPITQRHLKDSKCVTRIRNGVKLFNVNNYPFPYKIDIEVAGADQSSIDAIRRVGGSVTIVYMERVGLRAHLKPHRFDILPKTARPSLRMVHYLEKLKARGAKVRYVRPLWLIEEEKRVKDLINETEGETKRASV